MMSGDIFNCCKYDARGSVWPVPGRQRPELPVNIRCTGWPPKRRNIRPYITVMPRPRGPGLSGILLCFGFQPPNQDAHSGVPVLILVSGFESFFKYFGGSPHHSYTFE